MSFNRLIEWLHYECSSTEVFLYMLLAFALFLLLGGIAAYVIACAVNKNTEMSGIIRMKISLNDAPKGKNCNWERLEYDEYMIAMKDREDAEYVLKPQLTWIQKAFCRKYAVETLLHRYCDAMDTSGSTEDPARTLLLDLLKDDAFCTDVGKIYYRSGRKGLRTSESPLSEKNLTNKKMVTVYRMIPEIPAGKYQHFTDCGAEMICIQMEYWNI